MTKEVQKNVSSLERFRVTELLSIISFWCGQWKDIISEIQAVFHLQHPSLVHFIGVCLEPTNFAIVTELCSNGSLHHSLHKTVIKDTFFQSFTLRHRIAVQLVEGVQFLHSLQPPVIHRDLKSLNVVVSRDTDILSTEEDRSSIPHNVNIQKDAKIVQLVTRTHNINILNISAGCSVERENL